VTAPENCTGAGEGAPGHQIPRRVAVTTAWLEETRRKQRVYEAQRVAWHRQFDHGDDPDDTAPSFASAPEPIKTKGRRRVHDPRQLRFDF